MVRENFSMKLNECIKVGMVHQVRELDSHGHPNPLWLVKPFSIVIYLTTAANERAQEIAWCFDRGPVFNNPGTFKIATFCGTVVIGLASENWISDIDMRTTFAAPVKVTTWTVLSCYWKQLVNLCFGRNE